MAQAQATTLQAHEAYLAFSQGVFKSLSEAVQTQLDLVARAANGGSLAHFARGPLTPALSPDGGEGEEDARRVGAASANSSATVVPQSLSVLNLWVIHALLFPASAFSARQRSRRSLIFFSTPCSVGS